MRKAKREKNHGKKYVYGEYIRILDCLPTRQKIKRIATELQRSEHAVDSVIQRVCGIDGHFSDGRKDTELRKAKEDLGVLDQIVIVPTKWQPQVKALLQTLMTEEKIKKISQHGELTER